jgi:hypothetical protein
VIEWLLLDGIDMGSDDIAVGVGIKLSLLLPAYTAETEFAFRNLTVMVAEKAMKNTLFIFFIEHGFFFHSPLPEFFRFVKTFFSKMSAINLITMIRGTPDRHGRLIKSSFRAS